MERFLTGANVVLAAAGGQEIRKRRRSTMIVPMTPAISLSYARQ